MDTQTEYMVTISVRHYEFFLNCEHEEKAINVVGDLIKKLGKDILSITVSLA